MYEMDIKQYFLDVLIISWDGYVSIINVAIIILSFIWVHIVFLTILYFLILSL